MLKYRKNIIIIFIISNYETIRDFATRKDQIHCARRVRNGIQGQG